MPVGQRREIEQQLRTLPKSFSSAEISDMYRNLRADVERLQGSGVPQRLIEQRLHDKHKTLAFAYPSLFFKALRGELSEFMFESILRIKQSLDEGSITQSQARDMVVDNAKRHTEGAAPRPARPDPAAPGTAVQEITMRAQVDEHSEMRVVDS